MTGRTRDLLRGLRRLGQAGLSTVRPDRSPIRFELTVPQAVAREAIPHLERGLSRLLAERIDDLGIERDVSLLVEPAAGDTAHVAAAVDGRPAALFQPPHNGDQGTAEWAADVVGQVDRSLRRRLSLFLDEIERERFAELIRAAVGLDGESDRCAAVPAYLLDQGLSLRPLEALQLKPEALDGREGDFEIAEVLVDAIAPRSVLIQVDQGTLRRASEKSRTDLESQREEMYSSLGLTFPDVEISLAASPTTGVRFTFQNVRLPELRLPEGAEWHDVVMALRRELTAQAHWFLLAADVERRRRSLDSPIPSLVRLSRLFFGDALLTGCLRSLVRNGDSVRNLPRLLWLLLESNAGRTAADTVRFAEAPVATSSSRVDVPRDPDLLASGLRKRIAAECWRVGAVADSARLMRLPERVEAALTEPDDRAALAGAEWEALRLAGSYGSDGQTWQVVTRSIDALRPVRDAHAALGRPPRVVAASEFPPDVRLDAMS